MPSFTNHPLGGKTGAGYER